MSYSFGDGTYSHAYLLVPWICWLLWEAGRQGKLHISPSIPGIMLLAIACYMLLATQTAQLPSVMRMLLPLPLVLAMISVFGPNLAAVFPPTLLWFVTPIWGFLTAPLQKLSITAVSTLMHFTGIPVYVDAFVVEIPAGAFEIAGGCSGLRYVIAGLSIAVIYWFMSFRKLNALIYLCLFALAGALLTNWLRIFSLILVGHFTDMQSGLIRDHNMFGWLLFIPLLFIFFRVASRFETPEHQQVHGRPTPSCYRNHVLAVLVTLLLTITISDGALRLVQGTRPALFYNAVDPDALTPQTRALAGVVPDVYFFDYLNRTTRPSKGSEGVTLHFEFSGAVPESKPDYFLNRMIPKGWQMCGTSQHIDTLGTQLQVCRQQSYAVVTHLTRVNDKPIYSAFEFKYQRLVNALRLRRGSSLVWSFTPCESLASDCHSRSNLPNGLR